MEPDRYEQNHKFYIAGLACLVISMALFGFGAYIFPRVVFGLNYGIPDVIFNWITLVHIAYGMTEKQAGWLVLFVFFLFGFLFSFITYLLSSQIEKEIYAVEQPEQVEVKPPRKTNQETGPLVLKMLMIVGLIFVVAKLFQWAISTATPA